MAEVVKNMVLAGISAIICDPRPFPEAALASPHFLLPASVSHAAAASTSTTSSTDEPATKKAKTLKATTIGQALQPVVEELNPLLGKCPILPHQSVTDLLQDDNDELWKEYSIVVASRVSKSEILRLSELVTKAGNKLYIADTFGMKGVGLIDLGPNHNYREERGKELLDPQILQPYVPMTTMLQVPLQDAVNRFHKTPPTVWLHYHCLLEYQNQTKTWPTIDKADDFCHVIRTWLEKNNNKMLNELDCLQDNALKQLATVASADAIAPVCAVLGGILGNEIIKAISGKGKPANNTVLFDGDTCKAMTFTVQPKSS